MPFGAAKAVAATFCYHIRHVLVPIFGPDFVDLCTKPTDAGYGDMTIGLTTVQECIREARYNRQEALETCQGQARSEASRPPTAATWRTSSTNVIVPRRSETVDRRHGIAGNRSYLPSPQPSRASQQLASPVSVEQRRLKGGSGPSPTRPHSPSRKLDSYTANSLEVEGPSPISSSLYTRATSSQLGESGDNVRRIDALLMTNEDFKAAWGLIQLHLADAQMGAKEARGRKRRNSLR